VREALVVEKGTAMDVFEFAQNLRVMDDILVIAVAAAMFFYTAYPKVKRVACRVLVKAKQRDEYYRKYRG
jgi:hypothetical protein